MGLRLFGNSSGNYTSPNPNPSKFKIKRLEGNAKFSIALINYSGCTTYGGDKILVYACEPHELEKIKELDPHFVEGQLSPIARFPATDEGWNTAVKLVILLSHTRKKD